MILPFALVKILSLLHAKKITEKAAYHKRRQLVLSNKKKMKE